MYEKYDIKEIRFLPMSDREFATIDDAREYLRYQLPKEEDGAYWYQTKGINAKGDILVLFRIHSLIIGVGVFEKRVKNKPGVVYKSGEFEYNGKNVFYPDTIFNIATISLEEYQEIDSDLVSFNQSIRKTDLKYFDEVMALVKEKWKAYED
jgi:hypothetical protein